MNNLNKLNNLIMTIAYDNNLIVPADFSPFDYVSFQGLQDEQPPFMM